MLFCFNKFLVVHGCCLGCFLLMIFIVSLMASKVVLE